MQWQPGWPLQKRIEKESSGFCFKLEFPTLSKKRWITAFDFQEKYFKKTWSWKTTSTSVINASICPHLPSLRKKFNQSHQRPSSPNGPKRPKTAQTARAWSFPWMAWDTAMSFECHIRFQVWAVWAPNSSKHICHTPWLMPWAELENLRTSKNCFDVDLDGKLETLETEAIGNLLATLYHSLAAVWTSLCISMFHRLASHHALELSATYIRLA